jgi:pyrroloquinoline quinone biosynthesis protein B
VRLRVLGSAAGGGFPQWNCGCANCAGVRSRTIPATPRTQESLAFSDDGKRWFLINASPEIRAQIEGFEPLWPRTKRDSPIAGLLLTNGDLDHCLGLLSLRESYPISLYATDSVRAGFTESNVFYKTLQRFDGQVKWNRLAPGVATSLGGTLSVTAFALPGKRPLHLEDRPGSIEDNVGLRISDSATGITIAYASTCGAHSPELDRLVDGAQVVFFDGTFFTSDELTSLGVGTRTAEQMAHWPLGGEHGSLRFLEALKGRKVLIHLNNTNPALRDDSSERRQLTDARVEVAFDGMELTL